MLSVHEPLSGAFSSRKRRTLASRLAGLFFATACWAPLYGHAESAPKGCGIVAEPGGISLHVQTKCSPEDLKELQVFIQAALGESERRAHQPGWVFQEWSSGRQRNLGRLGELPGAVPVSPLHH
jgi:hypothetical protein